jgi:hypothetical protein
VLSTDQVAGNDQRGEAGMFSSGSAANFAFIDAGGGDRIRRILRRF